MNFSTTALKELREITGAGWTDCKNALVSSGGDTDKAVEWLRQRGIASSEKRSGNTAAEGCIHSYIHTGSKVGVLLEINCETDFVAKCDVFQELARNVAMQAAACSNVSFLNVKDIPAEVIEKERQIEMGRDDLANKKPEIREKIVEGRIAKRLKEMVLMDQPFIKDSNITVEELVKQTSGRLGEKIVVKRFCRFTLGE
jgi:elongation factor Ts